MRKKYVVYGESGLYDIRGYMVEVESNGTKRALDSLRRQYAKRWGGNYDNWGGFRKARIHIHEGDMASFLREYPEESKPYYATGATYRVGVFPIDFDGWE